MHIGRGQSLKGGMGRDMGFYAWGRAEEWGRRAEETDEDSRTGGLRGKGQASGLLSLIMDSILRYVVITAPVLVAGSL